MRKALTFLAALAGTALALPPQANAETVHPVTTLTLKTNPSGTRKVTFKCLTAVNRYPADNVFPAKWSCDKPDWKSMEKFPVELASGHKFTCAHIQPIGGYEKGGLWYCNVAHNTILKQTDAAGTEDRECPAFSEVSATHTGEFKRCAKRKSRL